MALPRLQFRRRLAAQHGVIVEVQNLDLSFPGGIFNSAPVDELCCGLRRSGGIAERAREVSLTSHLEHRHLVQAA
jgi:hypothetical protein